MKILEQNGRFTIVSDFTINESFKPGYYRLDWDLNKNVFLHTCPEPKIPKKVYDVNQESREMFIKSFRELDKNLGILLKGSKGTGKSIDAKLICRDINLPIIIIDKKIPNDVDFRAFLNEIEQEFVIFVDEFEKNFKEEGREEKETDHTQEDFLSIMDGLSSGNKKLFLFTVNGRVSEFLLNRTSRIKYLVKYHGITEELAKMIITDKLINKEKYLQDILDNVDLGSLTIDILLSIIEEVNIQDKPYSKFKKIFNYEEEPMDVIVFEKIPGSEEFKLTTEYTGNIIYNGGGAFQGTIYSNTATFSRKSVFGVGGEREATYEASGNKDHQLKVKVISYKLVF